MQFLVLAVLLRPLSFYEELHRRGKIEEESAKETDIDTRSQGAQDTQVLSFFSIRVFDHPI